MEEKGAKKTKRGVVILVIVLVVLTGIAVYVFQRANIQNKMDSNANGIKNTLSNSNNENIINQSNEISDTQNNQTNENGGKKFMQFDSKFYELKEIAKEYRLCENIKNYKDFEYDLDGDGEKDKITTQPDKSEEGKYIFKLNGKEFAAHYDSPEIYIVDLNESDKNIEVVVFDQGPSDDPNYTVYSKQNSKMENISQISGYPFMCDKKGTYICDDGLTSAFNPCIYSEYYVINKGTVETKKTDIKQFENIDFYCDGLFFTTDMKNIEKYHLQSNEGELKSNLQKANIKELDKQTTFKIIKFTDEGTVYVKLYDGVEGYIFSARGFLAG